MEIIDANRKRGGGWVKGGMTWTPRQIFEKLGNKNVIKHKIVYLLP
jgi:hypothetical protein